MKDASLPVHTCKICGAEFQMGNHRYGGKWIPLYQIDVCMPCWESNWDGWTNDAEEKIIQHLKDNGLAAPERNEKGWLPRA